MILLVTVFALVMIFTFGVVLLTTRPTKEGLQVQRRFATLRVGGSEAVASLKLEEYLASPGSQSFVWVEGLVGRMAIAERLRLLLIQADSRRTLGSLVFFCVAIAAVTTVVVYLFCGLLFIGLLCGVSASYLPIAILQFRRMRRLAAFEKALPDCIEMIVRALRAGYSIAAAINIASDQTFGPAKAEFAEVFKKQNYGLPMRDALMQMLEHVPSPDLRIMVTGILVQKDTGGNLAELMERIANVIRDRIRIQGVIRVNTAQGKLTGYILCGLPVVMMLLLNILSPGYSTVLFTDPFGQKLLYGGVAFLMVGAFIIRKIIQGIEV